MHYFFKKNRNKTRLVPFIVMIFFTITSCQDETGIIPELAEENSLDANTIGNELTISNAEASRIFVDYAGTEDLTPQEKSRIIFDYTREVFGDRAVADNEYVKDDMARPTSTGLGQVCSYTQIYNELDGWSTLRDCTTDLATGTNLRLKKEISNQYQTSLHMIAAAQNLLIYYDSNGDYDYQVLIERESDRVLTCPYDDFSQRAIARYSLSSSTYTYAYVKCD